MATLRELKGRIGSVASSEKITGAMKMISSAKMHKAEGALRRLVPYRSQIETIISHLLGSDAVFSSPLTDARQEIKHVSLVVLGSDDGLCGAYNVNIFKFLLAELKQLREAYGQNIVIDIYPVGKKMIKAFTKLNDRFVNVFADPDNINTKSEGVAVRKFIAMLQGAYTDGRTDLVKAVYMHFHSAGRQTAQCDTLLPMSAETFDVAASGRPYIFEPDAAVVFKSVLPLYLLSTAQEIFAQNRASEQAARVMAMQSANDNAKKLLEQLQLEYNKLRQQSITTELLDIVGGQVRD